MPNVNHPWKEQSAQQMALHGTTMQRHAHARTVMVDLCTFVKKITYAQPMDVNSIGVQFQKNAQQMALHGVDPPAALALMYANVKTQLAILNLNAALATDVKQMAVDANIYLTLTHAGRIGQHARPTTALTPLVTRVHMLLRRAAKEMLVSVKKITPAIVPIQCVQI